MIIQVTEQMFIDKFRDIGRTENFSNDGLRALFMYFEDIEESMGLDIKLDVIAICCDYSEYDSWEEILSEYGGNYTREDIQDNTTVIEHRRGIIIGNF